MHLCSNIKVHELTLSFELTKLGDNHCKNVAVKVLRRSNSRSVGLQSDDVKGNWKPRMIVISNLNLKSELSSRENYTCCQKSLRSCEFFSLSAKCPWSSCADFFFSCFFFPIKKEPLPASVFLLHHPHQISPLLSRVCTTSLPILLLRTHRFYLWCCMQLLANGHRSWHRSKCPSVTVAQVRWHQWQHQWHGSVSKQTCGGSYSAPKPTCQRQVDAFFMPACC